MHHRRIIDRSLRRVDRAHLLSAVGSCLAVGSLWAGCSIAFPQESVCTQEDFARGECVCDSDSTPDRDGDEVPDCADPCPQIPDADCLDAGSGEGLRGLCFDNANFTACALRRTDSTVDFAWGSASPDPSLGGDSFSVRWLGDLEPRLTDTYALSVTADDGARLWLDSALIINDWNHHAATENTAYVELVAGRRYSVRLDYFDGSGPATVRLRWSSARWPEEVIPPSQLYPDAQASCGAAVSGSAVCPFASATETSCADVGSKLSVDGWPADLRISNCFNETVDVYWIDPSGRRIHYATLAPGADWLVHTFVGHVWLITQRNGSCLGVYTR